MRIDPAGWPFIGGALALGVVLWAFFGGWFAVPAFGLAAVFLFFFRDPDRAVASTVHEVLSPADGRVMIAGEATKTDAPPGEWKQISIFLSPMDVHINRIPASGRVIRVSYTPGRYLPAYRSEAGAVNERSEIWIDHGGGQMVVARQIVGMLARRVVCRLQAGAQVAAGDRYGVMKFGSRMDVFVPVSAEVRVKAGETVRGGQTILAVLH